MIELAITQRIRQKIQHDLIELGYGVRWARNSKKVLLTVFGKDDLSGSLVAASVVNESAPLAIIIHEGSGLGKGPEGLRPWQLNMWLDPPAAEYLRVEQHGAKG